MANLETLELTIRANAESASQGVDKLIGSLTALSDKIYEAYNGLLKLNTELRKLQSLGNLNIKMPNISEKSGGGKASRSANTVIGKDVFGQPLSEAVGKLPFLNLDNPIKKAKEAAKDLNGEIEKTSSLLDRMRGRFASVEKFFGRIGRIASTMLIRTALRSLLKGFTNAWNTMYEFSKNVDGAFAQSIDRIKGLTLGAAQSLITAFSPALSALVPVVNAVAAAINYLANTIQWLFSLLGLGSELFGATTEEINKFANASSGGSSAAKEMLASFDELNVISSKSGGGGGGGGGTSAISAVIGEELANIGFAINEALLAVGLILACFGHPVIGVGLMALGAAGIVKTFTADWGGLSEEIKGEIEKIMAIVGVSFLAIGAALAFSGIAVPLGIGLMAIGAANMAGVLVAGFKDEISPEIKATITKITGIVGGALLALGAILLFFGGAYTAPMGIGLLLAGGLSLASAVALNWDYIVSKISDIATSISDWLVGAWNTVSTAVSNAWEVVSQWWGNILSKISLAWVMVSTWLDLNVWQPIKRFFTGVWNAIQEFWRDPLGCIIRAWQAVKDWVINNVWQPIKEFFVNVWIAIQEFWADPLGAIKTAWQNVSRWFDEYVWTPIKAFFDNAWNAIKQFWADPLGTIKRAWDGIANWINKNVWEPIGSFVSDVWNTIVQWWDKNIFGNIKAAWDGIVSIFEPIFNIVKSIWETIQQINGSNIVMTVKMLTEGTPEHNMAKGLGNLYSATASSKNASFLEQASGWVWDNIVSPIFFHAQGAYDIPKGDIFVANEAGAELVGSINGKSSVANQEQIIEGIARGVESANADQNTLLREQNTLLRQILQKDNSVRLSASAQLGRVTRQSLEMYGSMTGG